MADWFCCTCTDLGSDSLLHILYYWGCGWEEWLIWVLLLVQSATWGRPHGVLCGICPCQAISPSCSGRAQWSLNKQICVPAGNEEIRSNEYNRKGLVSFHCIKDLNTILMWTLLCSLYTSLFILCPSDTHKDKDKHTRTHTDTQTQTHTETQTHTQTHVFLSFFPFHSQPLTFSLSLSLSLFLCVSLSFLLSPPHIEG